MPLKIKYSPGELYFLLSAQLCPGQTSNIYFWITRESWGTTTDCSITQHQNRMPFKVDRQIISLWFLASLLYVLSSMTHPPTTTMAERSTQTQPTVIYLLNNS